MWPFLRHGALLGHKRIHVLWCVVCGSTSLVSSRVRAPPVPRTVLPPTDSICNVVQSVDHVLHCKGSNLKPNRTIFKNKFCKYVPNYHSLSDEDKLQIVLNFKPLWKKLNEKWSLWSHFCICQEHLSECTRLEFLHFCDMNVLLTLVNKLTYLLLTYLLTGMLMRRLVQMTKDKDMTLWLKMEQQEVKPQYYAFRWITLLLSQEFPLPGTDIQRYSPGSAWTHSGLMAMANWFSRLWRENYQIF